MRSRGALREWRHRGRYGCMEPGGVQKWRYGVLEDRCRCVSVQVWSSGARCRSSDVEAWSPEALVGAM